MSPLRLPARLTSGAEPSASPRLGLVDQAIRELVAMTYGMAPRYGYCCDLVGDRSHHPRRANNYAHPQMGCSEICARLHLHALIPAIGTLPGTMVLRLMKRGSIRRKAGKS